MADIFNMADTWNAGATTFTAIKMDVTDSASATASKLLDLLVGGVSQAHIRKDGRLTIGTNAPSSDNTAFLAARAVTGDSVFAHAYRDESTQEFTTDGAYASFDAIPIFGGSANYNHLHAFQARLNYSGSGTMGQVASFTSQATIGGPVTNNYALKIDDPLGAGTITNNYGIRIEALSRGSTNNWAFYVAGNNPTYLGGTLQIAGGIVGGVKVGGNTSSFPMFKNSSAEMQTRLADDSGYANLRVNTLYAQGSAVVTGFAQAQRLRLTDGISAPASESGVATIYVDQADGDLKIVFGDGTIKTIVVDT